MITLLAEQPCVDPPTESKEKRIKKTNGEEKKKRDDAFCFGHVDS